MYVCVLRVNNMFYLFNLCLFCLMFVWVIRWSARAIKSYALAELEARKLRYPNMGTEALLMGILVEGLLQPVCLFSFLQIA